MADYRIVIAKASTATNLAELPIVNFSYSRILSGCGAFSGTLPLWHPAATEDILGLHKDDPDREITIFRDDVPVWNGPVTSLDQSLSSDTVTINAREASWYLIKRVLEELKTYTSEDVFDIVRDLESYMENKTATGADGLTLGDDIVAALPRFAVISGLAGATTDATFAGSVGHTIQELFEFLAADPETGFEWKMDYATGSTRQATVRTLTMGYPSLGVTQTGELIEKVLVDFGRTADYERGATRVHVFGAGTSKTTQSAEAATAGILLTELVDDYSDAPDEATVIARAREMRRLSRPPVRSFTAAFIPGAGPLDFDSVDLGDVMPWEIAEPAVLSITADTRRVVEIGVDVQDGSETVRPTFNVRLDELAA